MSVKVTTTYERPLIRRACGHVDIGTCPHQVLAEFYENPKSNFVSIHSLELTYFTSADSNVKDRFEQDADRPKMYLHIQFCKLCY